jgi:hypothetical protein
MQILLSNSINQSVISTASFSNNFFFTETQVKNLYEVITTTFTIVFCLDSFRPFLKGLGNTWFCVQDTPGPVGHVRGRPFERGNSSRATQSLYSK